MARDKPFGVFNLNNAVMKTAGARFATVIVPGGGTGNVTIYGIVHDLKTTETAGTFYNGTTGIVRTRLVRLKADGTPDLNQIVASPPDYIPLDLRHATESGYAASGTEACLFVLNGTTGISWARNTPLAFVLWNADASPSANYFSINTSDCYKFSNFAQQGTAVLTEGSGKLSVNGLDERERSMWSADSGATWVIGNEVGVISGVSGNYGGATSSVPNGLPVDDDTRLPSYGLTTSPGYVVPQIARYGFGVQGTSGSGTWIKYLKARRAATLTKAACYVPSGATPPSSITVTVYNGSSTTVKSTATTGALTGTQGIKEGTHTSLSVAAGDDVRYDISSGTIVNNLSGGYVQTIFAFGDPNGPMPWVSDTAAKKPNMGPSLASENPWYTDPINGVAVPSNLVVSTNSVKASALINAAPIDVPVSVNDIGGGTDTNFTITIPSAATWITEITGYRSANAQLIFRCDPSELIPGPYSADVVMTPEQSGDAPETIHFDFIAESAVSANTWEQEMQNISGGTWHRFNEAVTVTTFNSISESTPINENTLINEQGVG